jgi:hypothetical protein
LAAGFDDKCNKEFVVLVRPRALPTGRCPTPLTAAELLSLKVKYVDQ